MVFHLISLLTDTATLLFLAAIYMEYLFLFLYFEPLCVLKAKRSLL
jgi:hypothetical protein